ncbi:MAG: redoxin family protein [Vulcanimicrobiaceae bacterium]
MKIIRFALMGALSLAGLCGIAARADAPSTSLAPVLAARSWYNQRVSAAALRGKVVVVDVFTVDCINCRNVTPELRKLQGSKAHTGLAILGVHSPETSWERDPRHVTGALGELGITWPVAVDDDFAIWNAYGVNAWPTQLFFDRHGKLRATIVGDSEDARVQQTVEMLLTER